MRGGHLVVMPGRVPPSALAPAKTARVGARQVRVDLVQAALGAGARYPHDQAVALVRPLRRVCELPRRIHQWAHLTHGTIRRLKLPAAPADRLRDAAPPPHMAWRGQ